MTDTHASGFRVGTAVKAGLIAGLIFLIWEMLLVATVGGGSPWGPPRMMGAIALGKGALPPPGTFELLPVMAGMIIHFVLSVVLAIIFALIVGRMTLSRGMMLLAGAVFGLIVYVVNFYGFTAVFPWFEMARTWITITGHIIFGVVLAWLLTPRHV